jgi:hypothetical protein
MAQQLEGLSSPGSYSDVKGVASTFPGRQALGNGSERSFWALKVRFMVPEKKPGRRQAAGLPPIFLNRHARLAPAGWYGSGL